MTPATPKHLIRSTSRLLWTLIVLELLVTQPGKMAAQDATPAATSAALPPPVERAACESVPPLTRDELDARMAALGTSIAADPGTPTPGDGDPVDAATLAAVTEAVRAYFACLLGGGANAQLAALTSDRVLAEGIAEGGEAAAVAMTDTATSPPAAWEAECFRVGVREARVLPDGRLTAIVDVALCAGQHDPDTGTAPGDLVVYVVVLAPFGDRYGIEWLDEIEEREIDIPVSPDASAIGTPDAGN